MTTEEILSKYNGMAIDFKQQSDNLLKEISQAFNQTVDSAVQNYITLQDGYVKGYADIAGQTKVANAEIIKNLEQNMTELRKSIHDYHSQLDSQLNEVFKMAITQFQTQCEHVLKKFPDLNHNLMTDALTYLKNHHTKVNQHSQAVIKTLLDQIEQKYKVLLDEVKIPEVRPPKITHLSIPASKK